jgi:carboxylesterase type B
MILGLQWAQREIATFGGDKNRVSIMGHSSGAQAVDQLSLSPKTAGLFQQIVIMSGPAGMAELSRGKKWLLAGHKKLACSLCITSESNVEQSKLFAIAAGCATEDLWNAGDSFEDTIQCLRSKTTNELIIAQKAVEDDGQQFSGPMMDDEDGILPESVAALMSKRRPYRMLIGTTNKEFRIGAMLVDDGVVNKQLLLSACVLMAKNKGFVHPVAVGRACAEDYSKRRQFLIHQYRQ